MLCLHVPGFLAAAMTASDEVKRISTELKRLSLKRQQLLERKRILCVFQELRNRAEFGQTGDITENMQELFSVLMSL